jgi:hypothetical protein
MFGGALTPQAEFNNLSPCLILIDLFINHRYMYRIS